MWEDGLPAGIYTVNYTVTDGIETIFNLLTITVTSKPDEPKPTYPDASTDSDEDRIPDCWELYFGLDPNDPMDASGDLDSDNLTNLEECRIQGDMSPFQKM